MCIYPAPFVRFWPGTFLLGDFSAEMPSDLPIRIAVALAQQGAFGFGFQSLGLLPHVGILWVSGRFIWADHPLGISRNN